MSKKERSSLLLLYKFFNLFVYKEPPEPHTFVLPEFNDENIDRHENTIKSELKQDSSSTDDKTPKKVRKIKEPLNVPEWNSARESAPEEYMNPDKISSDLQTNLEIIKNQLNYPQNKDIIIREFRLANPDRTKAFCVFIDGMIDIKALYNLLECLMVPENFNRKIDSSVCELIPEDIVRAGETSQEYKISTTIQLVLYGLIAVFIDRCPYALCIESKVYEKRPIERTLTESVVFGSQEGFVENLRTNATLIRRRIKNKNLVTETFVLGDTDNNSCAIMYIKGLANPALVEEVKRRIKSIKTDSIYSIGALEQFIEDSPLSMFPQTIITERPDRIASFIIEGKVAIIVDGSPYALTVPATLTSLVQTSESSNLRWQFGTFLRIIRFIAMGLALLLPGIYIALTNFHQEMIPTDLLISIEKAREEVPFPSIVEILLMEISFEIVREASIRVPGIIGTTVGIIGTLILGQAAVAAKIISPILVIVIAMTGLGSFTIPNYQLSFSIRILRFFFIFLGYMLGFYGISLGLFVMVGLMSSMKSFGVPFLSPAAPFTGNAFKDTLFRFPIWKQETRPDYIQPLDKKRQPGISRGWVKSKPKGRKEPP